MQTSQGTSGFDMLFLFDKQNKLLNNKTQKIEIIFKQGAIIITSVH
jgi:hypothetical protein